MGKPKRKSTSAADTFFDIVGAIVPSCGPAMDMVQLGQQRPLSLKEKFILTYNTPLCPHCNCKRDEFKKERAKYREIQAGR